MNDLNRPLSVLSGRSSNEAIQLILETHFPRANTAIDSTWGKGVFWKGIDIKVVGTDIELGRAKDVVADCRMLPFRDNSFDVGVLDLPFMHDVKNHQGTNLWNDYRGIGRWETLVEMSVLGGRELNRVCRQGYIIKVKDSIECGKYRPVAYRVMATLGTPYDMLIFVPRVTLATDPKWKTVQHFRRQESYFLIYK